MKKKGKTIALDPGDYDAMFQGSDLEGMGNLVGTGQGSTVHLDDDGNFVYVDFGPCGWCGRGHYISRNPNALFGECDYCGAT